MLISDLISIFIWWLILFIIGLIFLPLTSYVFKSFFDKGYAFSKILGLLLTGYAVWLLASLKILQFNFFSIILVLGLFLIFNLKFMRSFGLNNGLRMTYGSLKIYFLEEGLFLGGLLFWAFIKSHEPSIHGLEKFMDFGFINSILRSEYFPPKDMWLAPETINYYYFGHFTSALLIKLTNVLPEIGYNLTLASLFGLCLSASFSIGSNLYHSLTPDRCTAIHSLTPDRCTAINTRCQILSGFLGAFLVTLGGNLQTIYIFFQNYKPENPVPFWQLPMMLNLNGYWYPNATRFIPFTIHEFPVYSFVVSDLHGHVFDIPFVLLLIAVLITIFFDKLDASRLTLAALLIAIFLMTNVLDGPIYLLVIFIVFLIKKYSQSNKISFPLILNSIFLILIIAIGAIIFSLPFWLSFKPFAQGVGVLCAPTFLTNIGKFGPFLFEANHCTHSPLWMLLILWGFPLFIVLTYLFSHLKISNWNLFRNSKLEIRNSTDLLALTLAFSAFILILIPEFFYAKDIYPAHFRANTVFKFGYQAFIILGLVSGYMITRLLPTFKKNIPLLIFAFLLFTLVAIYPYFAINSYFNGLKNYQSLNGISYLSNLYPSDYQAILWLQTNIKGQPVILEAQGDSYTDFARVSANTGLPTVLGWLVHEWLWRGSYDEPGKRIPDISLLYESPDLNLTKELLKKYQVKYVFIGTLERQKYTNLNEAKFNQLGKVVFQSGSTKIFQI